MEALFYGKALVTTPIGADGLEDGNEKAFYVREDMEDFAKAILRLLNDEKKRIEFEERARKYAKKKFGKGEMYRELVTVLYNCKAQRARLVNIK